jgi:hypothetical protein
LRFAHHTRGGQSKFGALRLGKVRRVAPRQSSARCASAKFGALRLGKVRIEAE